MRAFVLVLFLLLVAVAGTQFHRALLQPSIANASVYPKFTAPSSDALCMVHQISGANLTLVHADVQILPLLLACDTKAPAPRSIFTIPFLSDDTQASGLSAALLATYLMEVKNVQQVYPFEIRLDLKFADAAGPEVFYQSVQDARNDSTTIFVGPIYSSSVQLISAAADVYKVPIMAYWATSPYLSAKSEYPNVWRTTRSDSLLMKAWVNLCIGFQWAHVVIIEEGSLYGQGVADWFNFYASEKGITTLRVPVNTADDIPGALRKIRESKIKIIVSQCTWIMKPVVAEAIAAGMIGKNSGYVWAFGDAISDLMASTDLTPYYGTLYLMEHNKALIEEYKRPQYAHLVEYARNQVQLAYDLVNNSNPFRKNNSRSTVEEAMEHIWDAGTLPTSLARALLVICEAAATFFHNSEGQLPTRADLPTLFANFSATLLGGKVSFDKNQDAVPAPIALVNLRRGDTQHVLSEWSEENGFMFSTKDKPIWPDGTTKIPDDGIATERYHTRDSAFGIIMNTLASVMCAVFLITFVLMLKYFKTPVFRFASSYSLLVVLLGNVIMASGIFLYPGRRSRALCYIHVWLWYGGNTLFYSAIIAKTWRVWMLFRSANDLKKGFKITNLRLMLYTALLATPAIIILIVRSTLDDNKEIRVLSKDKSAVYVVCTMKYIALGWTGRAWAIFQMLIAAVLSLLTRNVPSGFNETNYVFASVYISSTIGIVGLILLFAVQNPLVAVAFDASCDIIVAITMWSVLFLPKLYIALLRPELNTTELIRAKDGPPPSLPYRRGDAAARSEPLVELDNIE